MDLEKVLRHVADFPKEGIDFIDITTVLQDPVAFRAAIDRMTELVANVDFDIVVGAESRGFIIGAPLAYATGRGFVPIRKQGKLPYETVSTRYTLEYGTDVLEMHRDAVHPGDRVLIVDDLLATGGTTLAAARLATQLGGIVTGAAFLIELRELKGRERLTDYPVFTVLSVGGNTEASN
ncbi:MAG: adenine phosphoribosyltransferase [Ruminococcaceae bacterium]|nr:adenine phosphoribosyltransferase [Oscillospiraceae bacterium]